MYPSHTQPPTPHLHLADPTRRPGPTQLLRPSPHLPTIPPHLVLGADGGADDELVDVVELVPVLVPRVHVAEQRLKLGPPRDAHVERLGGDEGVDVKQVEVVAVDQVGQQLRMWAGEAGEARQARQAAKSESGGAANRGWRGRGRGVAACARLGITYSSSRSKGGKGGAPAPPGGTAWPSRAAAASTACTTAH